MHLPSRQYVGGGRRTAISGASTASAPQQTSAATAAGSRPMPVTEHPRHHDHVGVSPAPRRRPRCGATRARTSSCSMPSVDIESGTVVMRLPDSRSSVSRRRRSKQSGISVKWLSSSHSVSSCAKRASCAATPHEDIHVRHTVRVRIAACGTHKRDERRWAVTSTHSARAPAHAAGTPRGSRCR